MSAASSMLRRMATPSVSVNGERTCSTAASSPWPYDLLHDLEPVAEIASGPQIIVAKKTLPAENLAELVGWLRAHPNQASAGTVRRRLRIACRCRLLSNQDPNANFSSSLIVAPRRRWPILSLDISISLCSIRHQEQFATSSALRQHQKGFAVTAKTRLNSAPDISRAVDEVPVCRGALYRFLARPLGAEGYSSRCYCEGSTPPSSMRAGRFDDSRTFHRALGQRGDSDARSADAGGARCVSEPRIAKWWPIVKAANIKAD